MVNLDVLRGEFISTLSNLGFDIAILDNKITAVRRNKEIIFDLEIIKEYDEFDNETLLVRFIIESVMKEIEFNQDQIIHDKIFPLIRQKSFGNELDYKLLREEFTSDLDILFVEELDDVLHFLPEESSLDQTYIKEIAYKNLERIFIVPHKFDHKFNLLTYPFASPYNASMILLKKTRDYLKDKLGNNIVIAIPSDAVVMLAKSNSYEETIITNFMESLQYGDEDDIVISDSVYLLDLKLNHMDFKKMKKIMHLV